MVTMSTEHVWETIRTGRDLIRCRVCGRVVKVLDKYRYKHCSGSKILGRPRASRRDSDLGTVEAVYGLKVAKLRGMHARLPSEDASRLVQKAKLFKALEHEARLLLLQIKVSDSNKLDTAGLEKALERL